MRALWRRCGKVVLLGVALLVSEGRAPALGAEEYPPLPGPFEPMEPRQAERSGFAPLGLYLGGVVLHADGGIERRARLESFDSAPEVASESWLTTIWLDTEATFGDDRWVMETAAGVEAERDSRVPAPETLSGYAKAGLRMPLGQEGVVKTDLSWTQAHEARTTPLAEGFAATPTRLRTTTAGMEMLWRPGRLALDLRLEARREDYADVPRLGYDDTWDFIINNDDRDRDHMIAAARASWRFGPLSSVYVRGTASRIDYREGRDDFGFDRDSTGGAVFAGLTLGRPRLWRAFLEVGRVSRSMDSPVLPSVDVMAVNGGITWATTPLMTNQLRLHTAVAETTEPFAPAVVVRGVELETEHELLRSLVLGSKLGLALHQYPGLLEHTNRSTFAETNARWRIGRMARLEVGFVREQMNSVWSDQSYTVDEAYVRVAARF